MSESMSVAVSRISSVSDVGVIPKGLSFFDPYLQYYIREILEIEGEAYLTTGSDGSVSGIFLYDTAERVGAVFTRSRGVFDYFFGLKPAQGVFAEMKTEHECEVYDIYAEELPSLVIDHKFSYEISIAKEGDADEITQFMASTNPRMNKKWVSVALREGEACAIARLGKDIAGLGWASLVNHVGRLHSLYVGPQFRRIGIGTDILFARLIWLKSKNARSVFSEISLESPFSARIARRGQMKVAGQIFQYFRKDAGLKKGA